MIHFIDFGFRGVGSFGNRWTEIKFGMGLTQISGENGAGKSTLLECLFFALYGEPFQRDTINELVSWQNGKKAFEVATRFSNNKATYKVWRSLSEERLYKIDSDGNETELTGFESKAGFQNEINRLLGIDSDTARRLLFISADDTKPFPELKTAEKRMFIEDYFRLGIIGKMEAITKNKRSNLQSTVNIQQSEFDRSCVVVDLLTKQLESEQLRHQTAVDEHNKSIQQSISTRAEKELAFDKELVVLATDRDNINTRLITAKTKESEYIELQEMKAVELLTALEQRKADLLAKIDASKLTNQTIELQIDALGTDLETKILATKTDFNVLVNEHDNKIATVTNSITVTKNKIADTNSKAIELTAQHKETTNLGGGVGRLAEINMRTGQILTEVSGLKEVRGFLKTNSVCPQCNSEITDDHRTMEIGKIDTTARALKEEYDALEAEKITIESNVAVAKNILAELEDVNIELKTLNTNLSKYERDLATLTATRPTNEYLENKIRILRLECDSDIDRCKSLLIDIDAINRDIESETMSVNQKATSIRADAKNEFNAIISNLERQLTEATQKYDQLESNKNVLLKSLDEAILTKQAVTIEETAIHSVDRDLKNAQIVRDKHESQLIDTKKELSLFELGCDILGDKGVKPHFIKSFVPVLNKKVVDLLKWFSLPVHITFDEQLNMTILNLASPKEVKYRQHSKGERRRITTAILLSFIDIVSERMGWHCDQMFFDEFLDDGMDARGMESLLDIMLNYSDRKDMGIVIVSHKAKSEAFNRLWWLSKNEDGFSNVAVKE